MNKYSDCVLRKDLGGARKGSFICYGLEQTLCTETGKCPFYASKKTHYRDPKMGYIHKIQKGVQMDRQQYVNNLSYRDGYNDGIEDGRKRMQSEIAYLINDIKKTLEFHQKNAERSQNV